MAELNIGCDFTRAHVSTIFELCKLEGKHQITEVYGSPGSGNPFRSVRPTRRETNVWMSEFLKRVKELNDSSIRVNVTLNSLVPSLGKLPRLNVFENSNAQSALLQFINKLTDFNVGLIIAHPGLLDFLHEQVGEPDLPPITISTIMNVNELQQLACIKERWPAVTRVCPALWKNRDFHWLQQANNIIPLELLANEFCSIGGVSCEGLFRQACYLAQSLEWEYSTLPICVEERKKHPEAWLMARYILPQWIPKYVEETGVKHFKITGRTHPANFIASVGEKYIRGRAEGNLLELWGQLEATYAGADQHAEQERKVSEQYIPIELAESILPSIRYCSVGDKCGRTCTQCRRILEGARHA